MKIEWIRCTVPASDLLPFSARRCLTLLLWKNRPTSIFSNTDRRAASGMLLKHSAARLVESQAFSWEGTISSGPVLEPQHKEPGPAYSGDCLNVSMHTRGSYAPHYQHVHPPPYLVYLGSQRQPVCFIFKFVILHQLISDFIHQAQSCSAICDTQPSTFHSFPLHYSKSIPTCLCYLFIYFGGPGNVSDYNRMRCNGSWGSERWTCSL